MTKYTNEKKEHALSQMSAPHNKPVAAVAQLTGVPEATLYLWRKQAREQGRAVPGDGQNPEQWSSADKFAVVLEAASLNAAELAAYCRRKGLLVEQLERWRTEVHTALTAGQSRAGATERTTDKKRIRGWKGICAARRRHWPRRRHCWCCPESTKRCGSTARTHDCVAAAPGVDRRY